MCALCGHVSLVFCRVLRTIMDIVAQPYIRRPFSCMELDAGPHLHPTPYFLCPSTIEVLWRYCRPCLGLHNYLLIQVDSKHVQQLPMVNIFQALTPIDRANSRRSRYPNTSSISFKPLQWIELSLVMEFKTPNTFGVSFNPSHPLKPSKVKEVNLLNAFGISFKPLHPNLDNVTLVNRTP